jgi:hypothetical protein
MDFIPAKKTQKKNPRELKDKSINNTRNQFESKVMFCVFCNAFIFDLSLEKSL